jgi:hypothetical protein
MNAAAPGWQPDPTGRHDYRYWDGSRWTDDVSDAGATSKDPVGGPPQQQAAATQPQPQPTQPQPQQPPAQQQPQPPPTQPQPISPQTTHQIPTPVSQPTEQVQPGYGQPEPGYGSGQGYDTGYPPAAHMGATSGGSGPSTGLLIALGVLVVALVGGILFVLLGQGDDDNNAADDTTTTTTSTTEATTTTTSADDISSDQIVDEFATAILNGSNGEFTEEQAHCMASGILDAIGLERLAEVRIQAGDDASTNPVDLLTEDEQEAALDVMRECVPDATIDEIPT